MFDFYVIYQKTEITFSLFSFALSPYVCKKVDDCMEIKIISRFGGLCRNGDENNEFVISSFKGSHKTSSYNIDSYSLSSFDYNLEWSKYLMIFFSYLTE